MPASSLPALLICLIPLLYFPHWHLCALAPYLIVCIYRHTRKGAVWRAFAVGLLFDLLSPSTPFGTTPLIYCACAALLYRQKTNFFEDKLSTLPLMTFFFSVFANTLAALTSPTLHLTLSTFVTDCLALPLLDGVYALAAIALPFTITQKIRKLYRHAHLRKSDR